MKITSLLAAAIICSGCNNTIQKDYDKCMRRDIFKACVASIHTSDHGESVRACDAAALNQSLRPSSLIKDECK